MTKTLFLAWQDKAHTRGWFPVGRLDVERPQSRYRFRYTRGADIAHAQAGFPPLFDFPDLRGDYQADELFPLFKNRVLTPGRPDFASYLQQLDLPEQSDPIEILSVDGGYRATDAFEVFPKIERGPDGAFRCRFFLHGWRHVNAPAQERLARLGAGEKLYVGLELTNPTTQMAVQFQTEDYHMIGWAPRYLVSDLVQAIAEAPSAYAANVVRINPVPAPSKQRVLIELRGNWPKHEPMTTNEFEPLVK